MYAKDLQYMLLHIIQKLLAKLFGIPKLRTQVTIASMRKSCNHSCKINNKANHTKITNVIEIQN